MSNDNKKTQYLRQCWSAIHTNQTLALDYYLEPTSSDDEIPVMELNNQFSCFVFGLIDNTTPDRKILKACIKSDEVPYICQQYQLALWQRCLSINKTSKGDEKVTSPAYVVTIKTGTYKGRTPASILLENPDKKSDMEKNRKFLQEHLKDYPKNQEIIDVMHYICSTAKNYLTSH